MAKPKVTWTPVPGGSDWERETRPAGRCLLSTERANPLDASDTRIVWRVLTAPDAGDIFGMNARRTQLAGGNEATRADARKAALAAAKRYGIVCGG